MTSRLICPLTACTGPLLAPLTQIHRSKHTFRSGATPYCGIILYIAYVPIDTYDNLA